MPKRMQFMTRKRDAVQNEQDATAKKVKLENDRWAPADAARTAGRFKREDFDIVAGLPGRRSFGGFNPIMEKYYAAALGLAGPTSQPTSGLPSETTGREMAEHYESLVGLPRGPNQV